MTYDNLDKIGKVNAAFRSRYAVTLIAMWTSHHIRYARLRGKVLLREDLFRAATRGSADTSTGRRTSPPETSHSDPPRP